MIDDKPKKKKQIIVKRPKPVTPAPTVPVPQATQITEEPMPEVINEREPPDEDFIPQRTFSPPIAVPPVSREGYQPTLPPQVNPEADMANDPRQPYVPIVSRPTPSNRTEQALMQDDEEMPPQMPKTRPRIVPTVIRTPQQKREDYQAQIDAPQPTKDENGRLKSMALAFADRLAHAFDPANGVVQNSSDLFSKLAYAGGGAAGGVINPKYDEIQKWQKTRGEAQQGLAQMNADEDRQFQLQDRELQRQTRQNQIDDRNTDNIRQRDELTRRQQLDKDNKAIREAAATTNQQKMIMGEIFKLGYYKPGAMPELDARMKAAGIQVDQFENRKPETKQVNGQWFEKVPGSDWEPSNGIPSDPTEKPLKVRMANGAVIDVTPKQYFAALQVAEQQRLGFNQQNANREDTQNFQQTQEQQRIRQQTIAKAVELTEAWEREQSKYGEVTAEQRRAKLQEIGRTLGL
jgi:hypothetical protein